MSSTIIHMGTHTARRNYTDDGWDYIDMWISNGCDGISFTDARILVKYRKAPYRININKGDKYVRQFNIQDGETFVFRMNKQLYDIAVKYDLFDAI